MQLSFPRKCPDCDDGKKDDKLCIVCRGSGWVQLVPAMRSMDGRVHSSFGQVITIDEDIYA